MPKSETSIVLPPDIGKAVLPLIRNSIPENDFEVHRRIRTVDSIGASTGNALVDITIIVASSSPACLAIASIIKKWIQTKHSKKVTLKTEKGSIEIENLSSDELIKIVHECKEMKFNNK
ncbi:effector-associated constant component EACC1 [Phytobacter ursingii]